MSLYKSRIKNKQISDAILDELAYFAIFGIKLNADDIYKFLKVKTSFVATKQQLGKLVAGKKLRLDGEMYALKNHKYPNRKKILEHQQKLLKKARRWTSIFKLIPSVKAVVVINSVALGNAHEESDIDLFIVTSTNRIFITKGIMMYLLKPLGQLEDLKTSAGRFSLGMFITTKGIKVDKDMMKVNEPHLLYWLITAVPLYGEGLWYSILKDNSYISSRLPNYVWPKLPTKIYGSGMRLLDRIENLGYRKHLKHTTRQPKTHHPDAFIRIRPDVINLHHKDATSKIAEKWTTIRSNT